MLVFLWVWLDKVVSMGVAVYAVGWVLQHSYQNVTQSLNSKFPRRDRKMP